MPGPPNALTGTASRDAADPFAGYTGRGSLSLKNLLGTTFSGDVSRSGRQPASLSDVFGLDRGNSQDPVAPGTLGANAAQQNQLDQFRQILDSQTPGMSGSAAALANPNPWLSSNPGPALSAPNPASAFAPSPFAQNSAATPAAPANSVFALPKAPGLPVPSSLDPAAYTPAPARTPPPMEFKIPRRVF